MKNFDNIKFNGMFRDYQKRILDNASKYLADGKINIVAAPGSGKTTLGLELISRLRSPCIIFSPTTTIKYQWGSRFEQSFIAVDEKIDDYFSYDLKNINLFNSITYQALYSVMKKVKCESDDEIVDYSDIDLFHLINENGIKTICLDEAHHLQNEWQKALETFIKGLDKNINIISLTATPPYDATPTEWERYTNVCGEIDEEIFVPELVMEKTLCPHQDYIFFNYPTADELAGFNDYKIKCLEAIDEIKKTKVLHNAYESIRLNMKNYDVLFSNAKNYIALLIYCKYSDIDIDKKLIKILTSSKKLPVFNLDFAQPAIQFILDDENLVPDDDKLIVKEILLKHSVLEKGKVCLLLNEKLKRQLASSAGKLVSISDIVKAESHSLGSDLRMLILTDYIKKESVPDIGTTNKLSNINIVSIFETIRRSNSNPKIGAVSGSLIILPDEIIPEDDLLKTTALSGTGYSVFNLTISNKDKVEYVSRLFENGKINVLIGTKSLLGEGWDSPCINSLVLASFVGSFMLSNQMRGRAIRMDRSNPEKVSNIWHLVTIEPEYLFENNKLKQMMLYMNSDNNSIYSDDFFILSRRFDCFVGPNYETGEIENGIGRISILKPPFNKPGIEKINKIMLEKAAKRSDIDSQWDIALKKASMLHLVGEIPVYRPLIFTFYNILLAISMFSFEISLINNFINIFKTITLNSIYNISSMVFFIASIGIVSYLFYRIFRKIISNSSPNKTIKNIANALLKTFKNIDIISPMATLRTNEDRYKTFIDISLSNASVHEQNIFNKAITELLSPIENPRYLLVLEQIKLKSYSNSYACPSLIGQRKEYVEIFKENLKDRVGSFEIVFTRN